MSEDIKKGWLKFVGIFLEESLWDHDEETGRIKVHDPGGVRAVIYEVEHPEDLEMLTWEEHLHPVVFVEVPWETFVLSRTPFRHPRVFNDSPVEVIRYTGAKL